MRTMRYGTGVTVTAAAGLLCLAAAAATARVRLVGLPPREAVRMDLGHPAETLLEEDRTLLLRAGVTEVEFSWEGVSIDPSTIVLTPLEHPEDVSVLAVRYPPDGRTLVWLVRSGAARTERCRVSYLLRGIGRTPSYLGTASRDGTEIEWTERLRLENGAGERLEGVEVSLAAAPAGGAPGFSTDLDLDEARERRVGRARVPLRKVLVWDAARQPHDPSKAAATPGLPIVHEIPNEASHGLGAALLRAGKVRLSQADGRGGDAFLGEDRIGDVPVGETVAVSVGESRDVAVTRRHLSTRRTREVGGTGTQAVLWDEVLEIEVVVENFKDESAAVRVLDRFTETWSVVTSSHAWSRPDDGTLRFDLATAPGESETIRFSIERRNLHHGGPLR